MSKRTKLFKKRKPLIRKVDPAVLSDHAPPYRYFIFSPRMTACFAILASPLSAHVNSFVSLGPKYYGVRHGCNGAEINNASQTCTTLYLYTAKINASSSNTHL